MAPKLKRRRLGGQPNTISSTPTPADCLKPYISARLLPGEDRAAFDDLVRRIFTAMKPADGIEEMLVAEVIELQWEVLRYRRHKTSLINQSGRLKLEEFLAGVIDEEQYSESFIETLSDTISENLSSQEKQETAEELLNLFLRADPAGVLKINSLLARSGHTLDSLRRHAKNSTVEELVRGYMRREARCINEVERLLAENGMTIDDIVAQAFEMNLVAIETVDRLVTGAATLRNNALRRVDERRVVLGELVRRNVQNIEREELKVIEMKPARGKSAA